MNAELMQRLKEMASKEGQIALYEKGVNFTDRASIQDAYLELNRLVEQGDRRACTAPNRHHWELTITLLVSLSFAGLVYYILWGAMQ